jgi:Cof subfamily protein (haloacid dehalogenase superfamily)
LAARSYDALLLDIDGTLLDPYGRVRESVRGALTRARDAGVVIMLATGRGHRGTRPVMRELGLDAPALVFNGSALYCPREDRLIERLVLHDALVAQLHALALQRDMVFVIEHDDERYARSPRDAGEAALLDWIGNVRPLPAEPLSPDQTLRIALFSAQHGTSLALRDEVRDLAAHPAHYAHFPLTLFAELRNSPVQGLDVQPLCDGKAEAFRVLAARFGIARERVVAVGDADNDIEMLRGAGLGVAMGNGTESAKHAAKRVIGDNGSDALAGLIEELFPE